MQKNLLIIILTFACSLSYCASNSKTGDAKIKAAASTTASAAASASAQAQTQVAPASSAAAAAAMAASAQSAASATANAQKKESASQRETFGIAFAGINGALPGFFSYPTTYLFALRFCKGKDTTEGCLSCQIESFTPADYADFLLGEKPILYVSTANKEKTQYDPAITQLEGSVLAFSPNGEHFSNPDVFKSSKTSVKLQPNKLYTFNLHYNDAARVLSCTSITTSRLPAKK
jgi:hypothetical protein